MDGIEPNLPGLERVGRGHAGRRHGAEPVHRLRQGRGHRQGRRRPTAARCARSPASTASTRRRWTRRWTCARSPPGRPLTDLASIDAFLDAAPRTAARVEEVGPFTLFVGDARRGRTTRGRGWATSTRSRVEDVAAVRARQRELGVPRDVRVGARDDAVAAARRAMRRSTCSRCRCWCSTAPPGGRAEAPPACALRVLAADDLALAAALARRSTSASARRAPRPGRQGRRRARRVRGRRGTARLPARAAAARAERHGRGRGRRTAPIAVGTPSRSGAWRRSSASRRCPPCAARGSAARSRPAGRARARRRRRDRVPVAPGATTSRACTRASASVAPAPHASCNERDRALLRRRAALRRARGGDRPFTLFVSTGAWPYYARPRLGVEHDFTARGDRGRARRASASSASPRPSSGCTRSRLRCSA